MRYKPSKFNYIHEIENKALKLYNSMSGTNSFLLVAPSHRNEILQLLKSGTQTDLQLQEKGVNVLVSKGFLVPEDMDEDKHRALRAMEMTMDSTLHLVILPTEQCNFRCKYCYETFKKGKMDLRIQLAIVSFVRKNIHRFTGLSVSWFGGEPLEAKDVVFGLSSEFQKICKRAKKPYTAGITTNGYNLDLNTYNSLLEKNVYNYQITIDGSKSEHDKQRVLEDGSGTFEMIINNLKQIKNMTRSFNTSFILRTNFTKSIIADLDEYLKFIDKTFSDDPRFSFYIHMASDWGGERVGDFSNEMISVMEYSGLLRKIRSTNIKFNLSSHCSHMNCGGCVCYASKKNSIVIGSDGILYKCTGDFEFEKNKVGVIESNGFMKLNENYYAWLIGDQLKQAIKCQNCFYSACCLSMNCPAVRVRGLDSDICSFEKENLGTFLDMLDDKFFQIVEG